MKNNFLKYYITAFYLCSTFVTFAQPGTNDDTGNLEGTDTPAAPIDGYIWVLALVGLIFVFIKLRTFYHQGNVSKESPNTKLVYEKQTYKNSTTKQS